MGGTRLLARVCKKPSKKGGIKNKAKIISVIKNPPPHKYTENYAKEIAKTGAIGTRFSSNAVIPRLVRGIHLNFRMDPAN